jgi:hypothetical protein
MGPVVRVPREVADTLERGSLVEQVISTADAVDAVDVALGPDGQLLMLVEAAHQGYSELVAAIVFSDYVRSYTDGAPFVLTVRDAHEVVHPHPAGPVTEASVRAQLALAYYGDPGERRPIVDGDR